MDIVLRNDVRYRLMNDDGGKKKVGSAWGKWASNRVALATSFEWVSASKKTHTFSLIGYICRDRYSLTQS